MLIKRLCEKIKDYFYERKMKKQRVKRKYSDDMCWDLQYTLLDILPKMIETLRKGKYSYPEKEFEEVDTFPYTWVKDTLKELEKDFTDKDYEKPDINNTFTRWHLILKRISYCLIQADETQTDIKNEYEDEYYKQVWGIDNFEEENKLSAKEWFKKHTEVSRYDKNGKPLLHKFKLNEPDPKLQKKWLNREKEIDTYRDNMKTEAFNLINKYFWNLWD